MNSDIHVIAIAYADSVVPEAQRLIDENIDDVLVLRKWLKAFREKHAELKALVPKRAKKLPGDPELDGSSSDLSTRIKRLRSSGLTFREIGERVGIPLHAAYKIYNKSK